MLARNQGERVNRQRPVRISCAIALPADFRAHDMLQFNARDPLGVAERVDGATLQKGLTWEGQAACLTIRFGAGRADVALAVDGNSAAGDAALEAMTRRMLGLTQPVADFENTYRRHPLLGPLIAARPGLRVPVSPTPFEALTWAITGQQISLAAAISIRRKLIQLAGPRHSAGLACYPDPGRVARLDEAGLRQAGFSQAKSKTLLALSRGIEDRQIPLGTWTAPLPVDDIRRCLQAVRGIGPWTVDYALLRGFGWLDGSLHGDAAVRRKLAQLLGAEERLSEAFVQRWLGQFSPWRALVAAHLWAMPSREA
jgi:DNA-3-methyladenine glycosylase II